jgi:DNA-binding CsgD family transcriptional regulator
MNRVEARQAVAAQALVGRGHELELIDRFLDRAGHGGEALMLRGEPGVGKTALLDAAAGAASDAGFRVLRAGGVEFEVDMPFSALHQALDPLRSDFEQLNAAHQDALRVALGFGEGAAPDRLLVSNATLSLLRHVTASRALVLLIDDLPWLDRTSASVLGFVARRLAGSRIGFLVATRSGEESYFGRTGLPGHELRPLDDAAAAALLDAHYPTLAVRPRRRVLAEARGNPLALLELAAAASRRQADALQHSPRVPPLTGRLQRLFAAQMQELPARTRGPLLLAALDGSGDPRVLECEEADAHEPPDLAAAERAGLIRFVGGSRRIEFRHPLIRSAVVELSTNDERRKAHGKLAELLADQPDRRAWHLAEAAVAPDERVASLLEQSAHRILRRGDAVGAIAVITRSSELSPSGADRARRLAKAAYIGAEVTGEIRRLPQLLADARQADPGHEPSLETAVAAAYALLNGDGEVDTAFRLLIGTLESQPTGHDHQAVDHALDVLLRLCWVAGRTALWDRFRQATSRLAPSVPTHISLSSRTVADPARTAAEALAQLNAEIDGLVNVVDPTHILQIAFASTFVDRLGGCRGALWQVVNDGREGGAVFSAIRAMMLLARDDLDTGQWNEALQLVDEALELSDQHAYRMLVWHGDQIRATVAAARGDFETAHAIAEQLLQWAAPRGIRLMQCYAWQALSLAALGEGNFEDAYRHASSISPPGTLASHVPHALYVAMDLVEAAARTGRHNEAAAHAAALDEAEIAALSPRLALVASASAATAAPGNRAVELFEHALAIPGIDRWPFELARVQLAFGERLRRAQSTRQARLHLAASLQAFERLGARPWATRATSELRATGQTKARSDERDRDSLTPQEQEIATLAATGLTNKQIGERMFLSHRTVGGHLHRTFSKLGITSRAALRDALASLPPNEQSREGNK